MQTFINTLKIRKSKKKIGIPKIFNSYLRLKPFIKQTFIYFKYYTNAGLSVLNFGIPKIIKLNKTTIAKHFHGN